MSANIIKLTEDIWVIEFPLKMGGMHIGTKSTVIRLSTGELVLISPGDLDENTVKEINKFGKVKYIVGPNLMHNMFIEKAMELFPEADLYIPKGLEKKKPSLKFKGFTGTSENYPWGSEIEQHFVKGTKNLNEVVFYHPESKTLILTDLAFNVQHSDHWFTRTFMKLNKAYGHFGATGIFRKIFFSNQTELRESINHILKWDFQKIVVAHGEVVTENGHKTFENSFSWLMEKASV